MAPRTNARKEVRFSLPAEVAEALGEGNESRGREARERVVLSLYQSDRIGAGEAARALGVTRRDFLELLGKYGIPWTRYERGELEAEVAEAEAILRKRGR